MGPRIGGNLGLSVWTRGGYFGREDSSMSVCHTCIAFLQVPSQILRPKTRVPRLFNGCRWYIRLLPGPCGGPDLAAGPRIPRWRSLQNAATPRHPCPSRLNRSQHRGGMLHPVDPEAAPAACTDGAPQHHIPHVPLSAGLQHLVLLERSHLLHRQDRRLPTLQLRVCRGLYWTEMRIQRPGRILYAVKATQHVPDSQHSRWRHNSSVPGCHCLCSGIYSLAKETERNSSQLCGR